MLIFASFCGSRWLSASEEFLIVLEEGSEDFLGPTASLKSSGLDW